MQVMDSDNLEFLNSETFRTGLRKMVGQTSPDRWLNGRPGLTRDATFLRRANASYVRLKILLPDVAYKRDPRKSAVF